MIPNMSKLSKNWLIPEIFPSSQKFQENSRWDWILKFWVLNQVLWWKLSWKNTQYMEISQNQPILEHFGISGFREIWNLDLDIWHPEQYKKSNFANSKSVLPKMSARSGIARKTNSGPFGAISGIFSHGPAKKNTKK